MFEAAIQFIREQFHTTQFIPLHAPRFMGREKEYLCACIDSTFVSSVGPYVDQLETILAEYTGAKYAVATVNGTAALHTALRLAGVNAGAQVITQPLTFVATANAISYCGALPCFVDVDRKTLGMSPDALQTYLEKQTSKDTRTGQRIDIQTHKPIQACVPMHTFGHPCRIDDIVAICSEYSIPVVEDAAESLGSWSNDRHTGTFGQMGVLSFNGNKTITAGGGGAIITNDEALARKAKHITTTAKVSHRWEFMHDDIGYNYRMPNLNAALACAQLEQLTVYLENKRALAEAYNTFFTSIEIDFQTEPENASSNYWLNALILPDRQNRDMFLKETNDAGVMTRPVWRLMNELNMFKDCPRGSLDNAEWIEERVVNLPSSVRL